MDLIGFITLAVYALGVFVVAYGMSEELKESEYGVLSDNQKVIVTSFVAILWPVFFVSVMLNLMSKESK